MSEYPEINTSWQREGRQKKAPAARQPAPAKERSAPAQKSGPAPRRLNSDMVLGLTTAEGFILGAIVNSCESGTVRNMVKELSGGKLDYDEPTINGARQRIMQKLEKEFEKV